MISTFAHSIVEDFFESTSTTMVSEAQKLEVIQMILALQDEQLLAKIKAVLISPGSEKNLPAPSITTQNTSAVRPFGFAKGLITFVSPDFDETPAGFEEYMPKPQQ